MARMQLYLTDITYKTQNNRAIIRLFGRTPDGKQVCVQDTGFSPYVWVLPDPAEIEAVAGVLKQLSLQDGKITHRVLDVTIEKRNLHESPAQLLRVTVSTPKAVPALRDLMREVRGVEDIFEHDIFFVRRYLIDHGLLPFTLIEANVEQIDGRLRVPLFRAAKVESVNAQSAPSIRTLALDIETYVQEGKGILPQENPILMVALHGHGLQRVITWKRFSTDDASIEFVASEHDLLSRLKEYIVRFGPDALVTYNGDGFDLPYIIARAKKIGVRFDIGLDYSDPRQSGRTRPEVQIAGMLHLDLLRFIRMIVGRSLVTDSYSLDAVAQEILGEKKRDVDIMGITNAWDDDQQQLEAYCQYNLHDAKITYRLAQKLLPNMIELVKIIGVPAHDCIRMPFSQLVEWYCIRAAAAAGEIVPNKPTGRERQRRSVERIKGAFVYEPTPGLYANIAVFDYRSLYPSIIASHNISIGTLNCSCCEMGRLRVPFEGRTMWFCTRKRGFLSSIIEDLIARRARIKAMLKENRDDQLLSSRSNALKLLANSFYGYLGFAAARWYCLECAESTTAWGRHYITWAIAEAEEEGFKVCYSDTDSLYLVLRDKSKKDALRFAERINHDLPGVMELDFEGYFVRGIFVHTRAGEGGAKKRYALADERGNLKIRGFETVRRNTSFIAKDVQKRVLEMVLCENEPKRALAFVRDTIAALRAHTIPVDKVVIFTQLQKNISEYEARGPHVAAAERMRSQGKDVGPGSIIKYVVGTGKGKIRDKVRLPGEESAKDYDAEYYINNQILPAVERIFAVLGLSLDDAVKAADRSQRTLEKWG